jgi:membrane protein
VLAKTKQVAMDLYQAYVNWLEDDGAHLAASVSFYMSLSLFPLLLVLISATGFLLRYSGWGQNARERLINLIAEQTAPTLGDKLAALLSNVQEKAIISGPVGLLMLLLAAMVVFVQFDSAMDRIWNIPKTKRSFMGIVRTVLVDRVRAFVMLFGIGVFLIAGFVASMTFSALAEYSEQWLPVPEWVWNAGTFTGAVMLNWFLFLVIYKLLPKVPVRWSEAAWGALFASLMWEAGRRVLAALLIGSRFSVYGILGAFVGILLWMFYATTILFLGAEYIQVFCERCNPKSRKDAT